MEIIHGRALSDKCDYSFGDHLGHLEAAHLPGGFMKEANQANEEFTNVCKQFEGRVMTIFIDNIRLYPRNLWVKPGFDAQWVDHLMKTNDLLGLCATFPKNKFVIFCSHEDTPIDDKITIPENVLGIHAVNAGYFGGKVHPFPYGVQREINRPNEDKDNRHRILLEEIGKPYEPTKLLYINCSLGAERNNMERAYLPHFESEPWATCRFNKDSMHFTYGQYREFLNEMREHKFMICPQGHGMDCHRNWELLYMRRVPVMKDHPYFRELMKGWPVLFVKDWPEVTEDFLQASEHLYQEAQVMNLERLDLSVMFSTIMNSYQL